ncbi:unnamed protein product [Rotaria magnacalcarata]|uniref:Coiled-coil domain-containing protein 81 n=5 Tax=Rotaria magnacalcarata TaxID=392030 RepID=A0A816L7I3_9BILA|nr:unnamed protein product [Rotaria magnacalcarata]
MTDNINKILQNNDGNKQQPTAASIMNLTDNDVVKIWDSVSAFIESYMKQSKGIIIPGFGTFSFIHKRIDVGNNKFLLLQRPVFAISEKFAQTHGLKFTCYAVNGSIPVHPLNYSSIQTNTTYKRDQVEQCVKHVLQVFNRSIAGQRNVEFTFSHIGKLHIRNGKVKMKFFKDFISAVDENAGKHIIENMCNRPYTCDSVMSDRDGARPSTSSNVVLPRINSRVGASSMQAIQEENQADDDDEQDHVKQEPSSRKVKNEATRSISRSDDFKLPPLIETSGEPTTSTATASLSSHVIKTTGTGSSLDGIIPIASLFSSADFIQPSVTIKKPSPPLSPIKRSTSISQTEHEHEHEQATINPPINRAIVRSTNESQSSLGFTRSGSDRISVRDRISSSLNVYPQQYQNLIPKSTTSCSQHDMSQELCQVCHQRAKRNIPVYLQEEKRTREMDEEKILQEYQHNLYLQDKNKREAARKAAREDKQRLDAFNLGVAQATRAKKLERPQTTDIPRSIIFRKRVKTPPGYLRQKDLAQQLESQIKSKQEEEHSEKVDKEFAERLEQIQLAESLAQERDNYLTNKRRRQEELKNALQNQIRNKPTGLPYCEPEAPYFGLNDMSPEKLKERRLQAIEVVRQQKDLVEQRQRQQLLQEINNQEYELKVLHTMKEDLLSERHERERREVTIRKDLETDWLKATDEKRKRDENEKMHLKASQGTLIHEQCDQYKRCVQCQRNLNNSGKNNFWKDTRYIPGTHIMV